MTVIQVSHRELSRLRVMIDLSDGRLTVRAAAELMGTAGARYTACAGLSKPLDRQVALQEARTP